MNWTEHNKNDGYEDHIMYLEPVGEKPNEHGEIPNVTLTVTRPLTPRINPYLVIKREDRDGHLYMDLTDEQYEKFVAYFQDSKPEPLALDRRELVLLHYGLCHLASNVDEVDLEALTESGDECKLVNEVHALAQRISEAS